MKKLGFRQIWGMFMALVFFGMGILTLFTNYFSNMGTLKYVFGVIFFIFSLYRAYQIAQELRS